MMIFHIQGFKESLPDSFMNFIKMFSFANLKYLFDKIQIFNYDLTTH